jgi:hypothetical protein
VLQPGVLTALREWLGLPILPDLSGVVVEGGGWVGGNGGGDRGKRPDFLRKSSLWYSIVDVGVSSVQCLMVWRGLQMLN